MSLLLVVAGISMFVGATLGAFTMDTLHLKRKIDAAPPSRNVTAW
ncbi:hypothetical protein AWB80_07528 [Caballeronia pedi]|uniref:Uncharacterized protein n=1 Tax=Caballeronia pedi TaxID=1777141 RepID=A0A158DV63_9BURK|nr:hypothetical protein [Caballeronia pedi]SAK98468.1 hypothetical protein AWB80_07528 [Caballeronia pedi]